MSVLVNACLLFCLLVCVSALERGDLEKYGPFRIILNSPVIKCVQDRELNLDVSGIVVHFYDWARGVHHSFPVQEAAQRILDIPHLDKSRKFVMFVGGFTSHIEHSVEQQMRAAYRHHPDSYLVIPDHSQYTHERDGGIRSYERSVTHVHYIGKALGAMWAGLSRGGVSPDNIHLVGHSLGGQILGHAGTAFHNATGHKVGRVTALDPAGPCFTKSLMEDQVRSGVAQYVEVFHSNAGALGSSSVLGDVDYFINNGEAQPECKMPLVPGLGGSSRAASCNHRAVIDVWTASVKDARLFPAYQCSAFGDLRGGACGADAVRAGASSDLTPRGVYYIPTHEYDLEAIR